MKTKLLFITWDGPQTFYMEGLFMPIFQKVAELREIEFHVLQFTWGDKERIEITRQAAERMGVKYNSLPIKRKPIASVGSLITLFTSLGRIKKYIRDNKIDIVMPRSTFPAFWAQRLKNVKLIFDADGLPIEERVDFSGLKKGGLTYRWMKSIEMGMIKKAATVITRSKKSINIHLANVGEHMRDKFSVAYNGRDASLFSIDSEMRINARKELNVMDEELLLGYAGSLGPQYCMGDMLQIFSTVSETKKVKFLILTGNTVYAQSVIPADLKESVIVRKVPVEQIPYYLNAMDLAFGLRMPSYSMQGVAPIKLGEYLLCGVPIIASKGIGDSEEILLNFSDCFLFNHKEGFEKQLPEIIEFVNKTKTANREAIREKALNYFSLEAAAESYIKVFDKVMK